MAGENLAPEVAPAPAPAPEAPPQNLSIEDRISRLYAPESGPQDPPAETEAEVSAEPQSETLPEPQEAEPEQAPEEDAAEPSAVEGDDVAAEGTEYVDLSLGALAEHFDTDVASLYEMPIPATNADGVKVEVSLGELKDRYQDHLNAAKIQKEAAEMQDRLQIEKQQFELAKDRQLQETSNYLNIANQVLTAEFNAINWDELRANDPGGWAMKRQEFQERQGQLQQAAQQASAMYNQTQQEQLQRQQEGRSQLLEREGAALLSSIPEWQNDTTREAEQAKLRSYLLDAGYQEQAVDSATDHIAITLARKAMMYDEMQSKASVAKNRVVKLGKKVLKPGAKQSRAQQEQDAEAGLKARLKKSGNIQDAAALISHRMNRR